MNSNYDASIIVHIKGIAPCVRENHGTVTAILEVDMDVKIVGQMDNTIDHTFESANRVYEVQGVCPTLPTGTGGGHIPKILEAKSKCYGSN